jgi:hypothetical protein
MLDGLTLREGRAAPGAPVLLAAGVVVKLAALIYAWVFVVTAVREERARLAERWARLRFVADAFKLEEEEDGAPAAAAAAVAAAASAAVPQPRAREQGAAVSAAALPATLAASAAILRDVRAGGTAEGESDVPFGPERAKERLLRAYARAVAAYVAILALAALAAVFWDAAFPVRPRAAADTRGVALR